MDQVQWSLLLVGAVLLLNLLISWWNARQVGLVWAETKEMGGLERLVVWSAAIMSASGFSWCYLFVFVFGAYGTQPYWLAEGKPPILTAETIQIAFQLGYLLLVPAVLLTGLVIWVHSLVAAWRRRDLPSMGVAAWNTYAQVHNTMSAMRGMPEAWDAVRSFFASRGDARGKAGALIIALVVAAIIAGVLTTWAIINHYAGRASIPERRESAAA